MNEKTTLYLSVLAIIIAITGIGLSLYLPGQPGSPGADGVTGPAGPAGPAGPQGPQGVSYVETAQPETCVICHPEAGTNHQESYNELYQDGVIKVTDLSYSFTSSPDTTIVKFKLTKNGAPFNALEADSSAIYFVPYSNNSFEAPARLSLKGTLTYDSVTGVTTSRLVEKSPSESGYVDYSDVSGTSGLVVLYGYDEKVASIPNTRVTQEKYPFAALYETGSGVDYVSSANNAGCVKCHTDPYLKHGTIYAQVNGDASTDFYTCKACHLDNGAGGHFEWQLLVDDPVLGAKYVAGTVELTPEQEEQYAYKTTLMNDVHMSHSMEFPYPQSMSNCATCHAGKLDTVLSDENFKVETCKSCHPVTGSEEVGTVEVALKTILPAQIHGKLDLNTADCVSCHKTGNGMGASTFKQIHTGYDAKIYYGPDKKYSDAIIVKIDAASISSNKLSVQFTATNVDSGLGVDVTSIEPTVLVGLYGYDTKDYLIGPHERLVDDNKDGKLDSKDKRSIEYVWGEDHPRFTPVSALGGVWKVTVDLSNWADLISNNTVKRLEIGVMPSLNVTDVGIVALNAPSRTFDIKANKFDDKFYNPVVKITTGCNTCHDALATTFHEGDRSGNIIVCKLCHITKAGGSHLEMQSRSIESYVHSIHSFQAFDISGIDFSDPVQALEYQLHTEMPFPTHGITDCESCHVAGTYEVPDQSKNLPGILSASSKITGWDRNIGTVPSYVTGPAAVACGGCHRAALINEDAAGELLALNQHFKQGGYLLESGSSALGTLNSAIYKIMSNLN